MPIPSFMFVYRDLVTPHGGTIIQHQAKIRDFGSCWWGWWKKPIEDVPVEELLAHMPDNRPLPVLLFDSGFHSLWRATVAGVAIAPSEEGMLSPDMDRTPEYYVHLTLAVWLRFTELEVIENPESALKNIRYRGFPTWRTSQQDYLVGRQVKDMDDLDLVLPTMWEIELSDTFDSQLGL